MRSSRPASLALAIASLLAPADGARAEPGTVVAPPVHDFGVVRRGTPVEHTFTLRNAGRDPVRILSASLTPPLALKRMTAVVPPGGEGTLDVVLDTRKLEGPFEGDVLVSTDEARAPTVALGILGRVQPEVEVLPRRAVFMTGTRGGKDPVERTLEIVNHGSAPLRVTRVEHGVDRFTTRLQTLEEGQRYRLTVSLATNGAAGRRTDPIVVHTSSAADPTVTIQANTYLHERVYAFPETLELGELQRLTLRRDPRALELSAQTLMVFQVGGADFRAKLTTDVPFLRIASERGPKGDRFQATITIAPEKLEPGPVRGRIVIESNDPELPRVVVPVTGAVVER